MDWEPTEVHIEEMEWEYCCEGPEPMDWEDSPEVRVSKKKKASEIIDIEVKTNFQVETIPSAPKKVSPPVEPNTNLFIQEKENFPTAKKVSPPLNEIVRRKIRTKKRDKADGLISYRSVSEGVVARLDFPGAVRKVYISSERRKDSPRGTTGSRPPSGVPRATLLFH
ncbi:hypothetical protein TNCT_137061 [Trichonephila clavata]|uniref:Uncharacterized protein n=1 Tax=Trichonephila clavata TaxID=2740835 RepID=A0A8X6FFK3_TRICU|nr:hypothetical protein TNCT_137061 [Trichonephila clavata]